MKKYSYLVLVILFLASCKDGYNKWKYSKTIDLDKTTPIGLTALDNNIWIADGDNNQLVQIDENGKMLQSIDGFERPMHLGTDGSSLFVPEYGKDQITIIKGKDRSTLSIVDSLDAPAGVHFANGNFAIADFYNHRILYGNEDNWISFGKEGKADGEFYYPTDVHIAHQKIYVADAYNNRIQVFDLEGNHIQTIGKKEKINAATGIYVGDEIYVTDFENDRVLIYTLDGKLNQIIDKDLKKPTDILVKDDVLYITNYQGKNLMRFTRS